MRQSAFLVGLALATVSCTGARGIGPTEQHRAIVADPPATAVSSQRPPVRLLAEPVAVPSTTTVPAPAGPMLRTRNVVSTTTTTTHPPVPVSIASVVPGDGTVALTFDDGPFDGWTETILGILDERGVTATFFVSTYRLPEYSRIVSKILAAGHSVQSHGNEHDDLTALTEDEVRAELSISIERLVAAGAPRPTCMRPPYGATNATVARVAAELGLAVVEWTQDSFDYSHQEPVAVVDSVLDGIEPGDIVLMHDQWAPVHETALPIIIEEITSRDIGFSALCNPQADS